MAIDILNINGYSFSIDMIQEALQNIKKLTGIRGRFDLLKEQPRVIADVAHNEAGLKEVFAQIEAMHYKKLFIVCGFVKDKEVEKVLHLFSKQANYFFTQAQIPRALPSHELAMMASAKGLEGIECENVTLAMHLAMANASSHDLVLITGSFFILEEVYSFFDTKN